ncbi:DUF7718 family protein [Actinomycetospora flava]|uniref:Uncharacterized protein n=1 Tax=Actinomycetospora flava TaxID=3129232 RepID=A0ABU8LZJ1_9PSEU
MGRNPNPKDRRLVDMSPTPDDTWWPDLPAEEEFEPWTQIDDDAGFVQRLAYDQYQRLCEWAVIQMARRDGDWVKIAVYDTCHGKGVHRHLYNGDEERCDENTLFAVHSYADLEAGVDHAIERVELHWQENEREARRVSKRGR